MTDSLSPQGVAFTVEHEHFLKRELIRLELDREIASLDDFKNIGKFGSPFIPNQPASRGSTDKKKSLSKSVPSQSFESADGFAEFPLLRHVFEARVLTFPFLSSAEEVKFWQQCVQPFVESFAEKDISSTADREEATKRKRMGAKFTKMLQIYAVSGLHTTRPEEHSVHVPSISQRGIEISKNDSAHSKIDEFVNGYKINVEGVRQDVTRKGLFSEKHWEFLIRAEMEGAPPIYVARRFSDFRTLDKRLHSEFPGKELPHLPAKFTSATVTGEAEDTEHDSDPDDDDAVSVSSGTSSSTTSRSKFKLPLSAAKLSLSSSGGRKASNNLPMLPREKQRITLRAYLISLVEKPKVTKSMPFLEFLFKDRLRDLSKSERADIALRKKLDKQRLRDQQRFLEIAKERVRKLELHMSEFKQEILQKDGVATMFRQLKQARTVEALSPKMQKFVEWIVIQFAATLYHMFVAQDTSPELFSQVRRIHSMFPYAVLKGIMRWSNPAAIMKGMTDLFLAEPFGKRSLLQSVMLVVLSDDAKAQDKLIGAISTKIDDYILVQVLQSYVASTPDVHEHLHKLSDEDGVDVVLQVFRSADILNAENATVTKVQVAQVLPLVETWYHSWLILEKREPDSNDSDEKDIGDRSSDEHKFVAVQDDADKYAQLKELMVLLVRKRDKDLMQEFWQDNVTVQLIRELVNVFYGPLVKVFKSANIAESLGDLEKFMSDLVKVVAKAETHALSADPNATVQEFISLCQRHQSSAIKFINEVYINDNGLFDGILVWLGDIIDFLRTGPSMKLDLEGIVTAAATKGDVDMAKIIGEMDLVSKWIQNRRAWRDNQGTGTVADEWQETLPNGQNASFNETDFGLARDDLYEYDPNDESSEDANAPQRPELTETPKLLDRFHWAVVDIVKAFSAEHESPKAPR